MTKKDDAEEFLYNCFDINGHFTEGCVVWMLFKFGVLRLADESKPVDENVLFPPLDEDTIRASRERIASGQNFDNSPLNKSTSSLDMNEIRNSMESAANHVCADH
jgi:hypothetical protein